MPIINLAEDIARYLPQPRGDGGVVSTGLGGAAMGGILGSLLGDN